MALYSSFEKTVDSLKLRMSEPAPRWVSIECTMGKLHGLKIEQLRDLRYLIDSAIAFAEQQEVDAQRQR